MSDSQDRASRIGLAVPITPPKDAHYIMNTKKDAPPPQYRAFQNIDLDQLDSRGIPLPAPQRPAQVREGPNMNFYRPAQRRKRRGYIIAIVTLATMLIVLATFFGLYVRNHSPAQKITSATPIKASIPTTVKQPTTVVIVSTTTPTTTLVTSTTQTTDVFGITVLPSHATMQTMPIRTSLQLQLLPAHPGTRRAM